MPLSTVREYRQARALLEALGRDRRYRLATSELDGQELSLLTEVSSETSLTLVNYRNHLLISSNAGLVEAALRRVARPASAGATVAADFQELDLLRGKGVDATVLVNYRRLPALLDVLFQPGRATAPDFLVGLARNALLQVRVAGNSVLGQGFSNPETLTKTLHQRLRGLPSLPLTLADIMSTRTALLLQLAGPPSQVQAGSKAAPIAAQSIVPDSSARHRAVLDSVRATFGGEVAVAYLAGLYLFASS